MIESRDKLCLYQPWHEVNKHKSQTFTVFLGRAEHKTGVEWDDLQNQWHQVVRIPLGKGFILDL